MNGLVHPNKKMIEYKRLADVKMSCGTGLYYRRMGDRFAKPPKSVENLIKLIRLRLSATEVKIAAIREVHRIL